MDLTTWSIIVVGKINTHKNYNAFFIKGSDANENYEFLTNYPGTGNIHYPVKHTSGGRSTDSEAGEQFSNSAYGVYQLDYNQTDFRIYINGNHTETDAETRTPLTNSNSLYIGNEQGTSGRFLDGDIAELICFNSPINSAERIILHNTMAAKYGFAMAANDVYNEDDSGSGDYDHDVAGIGRVDASNIISDAQGTGIVRMLNPTGLGNDEFLMWGHDNGDELATETTDVPAGGDPVDARFDRVWRVSEANSSGTGGVDVGSINIRWDLTGKGSVTASDLRLLVDTDNDGNFADETPISGATLVSGNVYQFAGVSAIVNNYRFTLATINDTQTPLYVASPCTPSISTTNDIEVDFDGAESVFAIDLDGDGDIDVLGAADNADDITWWENDGSESFTEHTIDGSYNGAESIFAIDMDDDGDIDVLGTAYDADDITWWENDGSESFTEHTIDGSYDGASDVFVIDLDGDGDMDVLGTAYRADDITWWENDGSENFTEHTIDGSYDGADNVYAIDIDGDGDIDVLGVADRADDITWWENDGSENFTEHTIDGSFDGARSVFAVDMDGDGDIDVLGTADNADDITWFENDGSENFTEQTIDGNYNGARDVYATDIDCDGDMDVVGAAFDGDEITWWENDGTQSFTKNTIDASFNGPKGIFVIDIDDDGDLDILGAADNGDDITWWEQDGCPCATSCEKVFVNRHIGFRVRNN